MAVRESPCRAKSNGNNPHAIPSLRLLVRPAAQLADSAGSRKLVVRKISRIRVAGCWPGPNFAWSSNRTYAWVSRTSRTDKLSPSPA